MANEQDRFMIVASAERGERESDAPPGGGGAATEKGSAGSGSATKSAKPSKAAVKPRQLPRYHVVLLNDDDHTYEYVVIMLAELFAHPPEKGLKLAQEVDSQGRVIVLTTHRELAELKRDQILGYGADRRISSSQGSMSAIIEPAE